jgi:hypothetical protein
MTTDEAKSIYNRLFTAFPHLKAYLDNTDNPQATFDAWKRMLSHSRLDDAENALDKIFGGSCEVPTKPWDMGTLAVWLRSVIGRVADDRAKLERQAATRRTHPRSQASQARQAAELRAGMADRGRIRCLQATRRNHKGTQSRNHGIRFYDAEPSRIGTDGSSERHPARV